MTALAIVAAAAVLGVVWWLNARHAERTLRGTLRRRAVVTLTDGQTFDGVLHSADGHCLVLRSASLLGAGERGAPAVVDGEVLVLRSTVAYVQLP